MQYFPKSIALLKLLSNFAPANTGIAQLVEHRSPKPGVGSSSLSSRAIKRVSDKYLFDTLFIKSIIKE